jgi:hypothetical protein
MHRGMKTAFFSGERDGPDGIMNTEQRHLHESDEEEKF